MRILQGTRAVEAPPGWRDAIERDGRPVVIDLGAGDGRYVYDSARHDPSRFYVAVEPNADALSEYAYRATRKPARGGVENVAFVVAAVERLPPELARARPGSTRQLPLGQPAARPAGARRRHPALRRRRSPRPAAASRSSSPTTPTTTPAPSSASACRCWTSHTSKQRACPGLPPRRARRHGAAQAHAGRSARDPLDLGPAPAPRPPSRRLLRRGQRVSTTLMGYANDGQSALENRSPI